MSYPTRILFLAVPVRTYETFFKRELRREASRSSVLNQDSSFRYRDRQNDKLYLFQLFKHPLILVAIASVLVIIVWG